MNKQKLKSHILSTIIHNKCEWNSKSMNDIFNEYSKISQFIHNSKKTHKQVNQPINKSTDWITIDKQYDSLFLIFFILQKGYEQYEFFKNKNQLIHEEKLRIIDILNNEKLHHKEILKKMKVRIQLDNILNEIAVGRQIDPDIFFALCCVFEIPIILLYKKYYIKNKISDTYHIINIEDSKLYITPCKESRYNKSHICGYTLNRPLLSISSYKMPEIIEMATILNIDIMNNNKKKTKKILYDDIRHIILQ